MPVLSGPGALDALLSYAHVVCGNRISLLHVTPDQIQPISVDGDGIGPVADAARHFKSPSLCVFEGANRAPTEAYLTPFLQVFRTTAAGHAMAPRALPRSLYWAATVADGAATLPISRDLLAQAVVLHVGRGDGGQLLDSAPTELALSSELMETGEAQTGVVETLLTVWPQAIEVEACLWSYAAALSRFESDPKNLMSAVIECVLLPLVASLPGADERADALERLQRILRAESGDSTTTLSDLLKQLRRRLA
jgi:hypothetical protein